MRKEKARKHFLGQDGHKRLNCGQTIIHAFKEKFSLPDDLIALLEGCGSGKAPEGLCGAFYAAKVILENHHSVELKECEEAFVVSAGSTKCKDIRSLRKLTCLGCVEKSAEFLENIQYHEKKGTLP